MWHFTKAPASACWSQELENLALEREKPSERISYKLRSSPKSASVDLSLPCSPNAEFFSPARENEVLIREPLAASGF